jgi:hypothetical protein
MFKNNQLGRYGADSLNNISPNDISPNNVSPNDVSPNNFPLKCRLG